jgi:hypothetical protein
MRDPQAIGIRKFVKSSTKPHSNLSHTFLRPLHEIQTCRACAVFWTNPGCYRLQDLESRLFGTLGSHHGMFHDTTLILLLQCQDANGPCGPAGGYFVYTGMRAAVHSATGFTCGLHFISYPVGLPRSVVTKFKPISGYKSTLLRCQKTKPTSPQPYSLLLVPRHS